MHLKETCVVIVVGFGCVASSVGFSVVEEILLIILSVDEGVVVSIVRF